MKVGWIIYISAGIHTYISRLKYTNKIMHFKNANIVNWLPVLIGIKFNDEKFMGISASRRHLPLLHIAIYFGYRWYMESILGQNLYNWLISVMWLVRSWAIVLEVCYSCLVLCLNLQATL